MSTGVRPDRVGLVEGSNPDSVCRTSQRSPSPANKPLVQLAIDGKRLIQARTGPARWLEHMLHHWSVMEVPFEAMRCYTPAPTENRWARPPKLSHAVLASPLPPFLWENLVLRRAASRDDILFGASYTIPLGYPKRAVVSIQGIYEGPNAEPGPWWQRYRFSAMYRSSAERAALVLANSVSTKNDLIEYYGIDPSKIRIVYQGVGAPFGWREDRKRLATDVQAITGRVDPYFLFVGKLSVRRHVPELLRAFSEALPRLPAGMRLVLVGPNHVGLPLREHIAQTGLDAHVLYIPHLEQEKLAALYSGATAFFLPTTHEGLSATILEAMACGTPVVTVEHAPLNEGFRENALVLEAPDVGLLRDAMLRVAAEAPLRDELSAKGRACAARFSWRRTAEETMAALWEAARA
ncbi:MAG: glycosyltransferase family 4 protein [Gemmatimonadetes bacterium]|nr:glycosyltransferase family 4 protein [Gemmatimonadota bacterium]